MYVWKLWLFVFSLHASQFWGVLSGISEKAVAPHSSTLAWKIPWTEEPGRLQSMGSLLVGHDWATSLSRIGEGNGNPLQCSCLENPRDGGAWCAAVYGIAQSRTRLKRLSSSSIFRVFHSKWGAASGQCKKQTGFLKAALSLAHLYNLLGTAIRPGQRTELASPPSNESAIQMSSRGTANWNCPQ